MDLLGDASINIVIRGDDTPLRQRLAASNAELNRFVSTKRGIFAVDIERAMPGALRPETAVKNMKVELDRTMGAFKTTATLSREVRDSSNRLIGTIETPVKTFRGDLSMVENLQKMYSKLGQSIGEASAEYTQLGHRLGNLQRIRGTLQTDLSRELLDFESAQMSDIRRTRNNRYMRNNRFISPAEVARLRAERMANSPEGAIIASTRRAISDIENNINSVLTRRADIANASPTVRRARNILSSTGRQFETSEAPFPAEMASILRQSPEAYRTMRRAGIGGAAFSPSIPFIRKGRSIDDIAQTMGQSIESIKYTQDEARGLTRATVAWRDKNNQIRNSNFEIDKNGKVLTRWGSQLSNINNVVRQSARNIFKVAEWTIATTAVLGSVKAMESAIETVKELEKNMRSFGITAQLSTNETRRFFRELSEVAINTATPILELTKAADDMALATKRANQTTAEWQNSILELSNSVGILTNLSGMDTVQATDLLTSTMKQLGITTDQLVPILNQITAVAGGQQNAITDIARGMGVMAEAASQAGLSTEQTIATIQVLSQVTSKSAAEVATAFKNLVGSVDSRASIKALSEFGISVRDESGNLKNFLTVYRDIQKAIESGVIPEGRVKEVVKAISGGPRRAPDAAALLANVGQIFTVEEQALNATNEALIANAKILDTVNAKTIKLQNTLKTTFFERFGEDVSDVYSGSLDLFTGVAESISKIDTGLITVIASAVGLVGLFKAFSSITGLIAKTSSNIKQDLQLQIEGQLVLNRSKQRQLELDAMYVEYAKAEIALGNRKTMQSREQFQLEKDRLFIQEKFLQMNITGQIANLPLIGGLAGKSLKIPKAIGTSALFGGISAGISAGMGGSPMEIIGSGLRDAGLGLALSGPSAQSKGLGIALTVIGQLLTTFKEEAKATKEEVSALNEELLTQLETSNKLQSSVEGLKEQQEKYLKQIERLQKIENKTEPERKRLNELVRNYAISFAQATKTAEEFNQVLEKIGITAKELSEANISDKNLQRAISTLASGGLSDEDRKIATNEITRMLLSAKSPDIAALFPGGQPVKPITPTATSFGKLFAESTKAFGAITSGSAFGTRREEIDLERIMQPDKARDIFKLFDKETGAMIGKFTIAADTVLYLQQALAELERQGVTGLQNIQAEVTKMARSFIFSETELFLATSEAFITAQELSGTPGFSSSANAGRRKNMAAYDSLIKKISSLPETRTGPARGELTQSEAKALIEKTFLEKDVVTGETVPKPFINIAALQPLAAALEPELNKLVTENTGSFEDQQKAIAEWANEYGISVLNANYLLALNQGALGDTAEALLELEEQAKGFGESTTSALRQMFSEVVNGNMSLKEFTTNAKNLKDTFTKVSDINKLQSDLTEEKGSGFLDKIFGPLLNETEKIDYFFNIADKGVEGLTQELFDLYTSGELSTKGLAAIALALELLKKGTEDPIILKFGTKIMSKSELDALGVSPEDITQKVVGQSIVDQFTNALKTIMDPSAWKDAGSSFGESASESMMDLSKELLPKSPEVIKEIERRARKLQTELGWDDKNKNDMVAIMDGTTILAKVFGVGSDVLSQAMDELTEIEKKRLEQETKADTLRRIRVGSGEFAGIANVPLNRITGVSMGKEGPINVRLDINGQILTDAQLQQIADMVLAGMKLRG